MAAQAGFCLTWSETPEDTFCRVVDQLNSLASSRKVKTYGKFFSRQKPEHAFQIWKLSEKNDKKRNYKQKIDFERKEKKKKNK